MITRNLILLLAIFTFGILSSCNKSDEKDNPFHYIDLEYFEMFSAEGATLFLNFNTLETFPCSNFTLEVIVTPSTNHTDISISNIDVPDVCITAVGPANYLLSIPKPANDAANYTVWVNDKRHDFTLKTNPTTISVVPGNHFDNHLFFAYDSIMRIPEGTIWGYALFDSNQKGIDIWARIIKAFEEAGTKQIILPNGNYYYFDVKEHNISFENIKQNSQTFYFHFENEIDKLVSIYQDIKSEYQNSEIQLRLFSTNGDRLVL
jgi:hypothetical protein